MDNLASSEDDALLRQLADDQIEHLVKQPYGRTESHFTGTEDVSYVPEQWESDLLVYDDAEAFQSQGDDQTKSAKTFILKSPTEIHEVVSEEHEELLETPAVPTEVSAASAKVAELIAQLQAEKAAEKAKQAKLQAQARQEEALAEAISGELLNPEDIDSDNVRMIGRELPLEDIEATFAPQVPKAESTATSANIAEEILSRRMAAEEVMGEESADEMSDSRLLPKSVEPEALPTRSAVDSGGQYELGKMKSFMITLAVIALTAVCLMLVYSLLFG